jgi:uncharacterized protein (DUF488 family)
MTIGHSTHGLAEFRVLLSQFGVQVVADVRSSPYSRTAPQFNEPALHEWLTACGIDYVPLGPELGGRPEGPGMYDEEGHVRYDRVSQRNSFKQGIARLVSGSKRFQIAILCSEEDPTDCHRRLLVGRVLADYDVEVLHLRGDGRLQSEAELVEEERIKHPNRYQGSLFGSKEEAWRSIRSVSGNTAPPNSSQR